MTTWSTVIGDPLFPQAIGIIVQEAIPRLLALAGVICGALAAADSYGWQRRFLWACVVVSTVLIASRWGGAEWVVSNSQALHR